MIPDKTQKSSYTASLPLLNYILLYIIFYHNINCPCYIILSAKRGKNSECDDEKDEIEEFDNEIYHILSTIDEDTLKKNGHQFDEFIVSCRFNGIRCR